MPSNEEELERNFFAGLRRRIICAEDGKQASSSTTRKRHISDTIGDNYSGDAQTPNEHYTRQNIRMKLSEDCSQHLSAEEGGSPPSLQGALLGNPMERSDAASLRDTGVCVAVKSPLTLFNEFAELVYQTADENMKRWRNPFDDLAKGIYRGINYPMMTGGDELDNFVKSAYLSNDLNDGATSYQFEGTTNNEWLSKYEEFRKYKDAHGNCMVRQNHPTLGTWVQTQRRYCRLFKEGKKSSITQERFDLLNSIGFV